MKKNLKLKTTLQEFLEELNRGKGHHLLIMAWKLVEKKLPNLNLYIVGNGDSKYVKFLKKIINKEKINKKKITWLNYTNNIY